MASYQIDGRDAALLEIRDWLNENAPSSAPEKKSINFTNIRSQKQFLAKKIVHFKQHARISSIWRDELSDRLKIQPEDIVLATNTIIEMLEKELSQGGTVRLTYFGDIKTYEFETGRQVRFIADEAWIRELNAPLFADEIGLKQRIKKKRLLRRRLPA